MALQKKETWKMKKWYSIIAPSVFNGAPIGEMPANEDSAAIGRSVTVSLDALTHNPSHAYTTVKLKVTGVNGNSAETKLVSLEQLYSYIRSLVRKYRSIASLVQPAKTKDNTDMVLKLIIITRERAAANKIAGLRKEASLLAKNYITENDCNAVVTSILEGKFQAELSSKLSHIVPLSKIEVRKLEIA
jgi:small subunit ribosomal protein S3Ae